MEKPNGFSFLCPMSPWELWRGSRCSPGVAAGAFTVSFSLLGYLPASTLAGGYAHRFPTTHSCQATRPGPVAPFLAPPLCPSPPAVLSGASQCPLEPPQGTGLPGVQPAAPTLPHESPPHPHPRPPMCRKQWEEEKGPENQGG